MTNLIEAIKEANLEITVNLNGQGFITKNSLASLLGIAHTNLSGARIPQRLAVMLTEQGFDSGVIFENGVPDIACACIIKYYAYYANQKSNRAVKLDEAFAAIGVRTFFQQVAGYQQQTQPALPSNYKEALIALVAAEEEKEALTAKLAEAEPLVEKLAQITSNISKKTGLQRIVNTTPKEGNELFTVKEYCEERGITLDKGEMVKVSRHVAEVYKAHYDCKPATKSVVYYRGNRRCFSEINVYQREDAAVIRRALFNIGLITGM